MTVTALRPTPAARSSALTPWDFFPTTRASDAAPARTRHAGAARAWVDLVHAEVAALVGLAEPDEDGARPGSAVEVAHHLLGVLDPVGPGADPVSHTAAVRRVLVGYDHHLGHHRFLTGARAGLEDFVLWEAVVALPVGLGEAGAARALHDLPRLRRWARRLARTHAAAVQCVGRAGVLRARDRVASVEGGVRAPA